MNSYILVPIANNNAIDNFNATVYKKVLEHDNEGYWTVAGTGGENTKINDLVIFYSGKNNNHVDDNCILAVGVVTKIVKNDTHIHFALKQQWNGEWAVTEKNIMVFSLLPNFMKMSYDTLLSNFSTGERMKNGTFRANPVTGKLNGKMCMAIK